MTKIIFFGAGGRVGPVLVEEAVSRGHDVTAVVRLPRPPYAIEGARIVEGDVSGPASVSALAAGHDVAVSAIGNRREGVPLTYLADIARTLLTGTEDAGVKRLIVVGGSGSLEIAPGVRVMDTPEFNPDWKPVALAHADALEFLRNAQTDVDWVFVSPADFFEQDGIRTGTYRIGGDQLLTDPDGRSHISYADFALAILDEIEHPNHHRERISIAD